MNIPISEIFVSYQGEGLFVGTKNLFVRFAGCNLKCSYCDEKKKGYKKLSVSYVVNSIKKILRKDYGIKIISLTGGEPLLYSEFLKSIIKDIRRGRSILLETNATLVDNLEEIIDYLDIVSADIKLPQYCGLDFFDIHREFLKISSKKNLYVKVVFDDNLIIRDFKRAVDIVYSINRKIPFFIQPESKSFIAKKYFNLIEKIYNIASKKLSDVRFLPQFHKYLDIK